jgi:eukaryotic-like serine/threonine-protein kinase
MHDAPRESKETGKIPEVALARVGTVLKQKWRLDRLLGVGGMAVVYAATHRNGKRVAIKMLHQDLSRNVDVRTRFLREGYLANAVDHDGVVSIIDDDVTDDGVVFLVMELLEGETIERRWERKDRRLPVVETLSIANELLDVLAAAHDKGVVHRDIKPENIILTRTGNVKVLDFGIARLRQLSSAASTTQSGATMGTPAFMSPEQARGRWDEVDGRSDLWAVGATMFALLTGRFVHRAGTLNEQLLAAMTTVAPSIASLLPDLTPEVAHVVDRALSFNVADRWPDARAMQAGIREAYAATRAPRADAVVSEAAPPPSPLGPPRTSAVDPDETEAMAPLDFGSPETLTIEQGVADSPSAAPEAHVLPMRRSPIYVGISAGALGVVLALAALVHHPGTQPLGAMARAHAAVEVAPAGLQTDPVLLSGALDAGFAEIGHGTPAPPATGVPASLPSPPSSSAPSAHHAASSAPEPSSATTGAPLELSGAPEAPEPPSSAQNPSASTAPVEPPAAGGASEGLLDRRH